MPAYGVPFWKQTPLFRLIIPFIIGIVVQWYVGISLFNQLVIAIFCLAIIIAGNLLPVQKAFSWLWLQGVAIMLFLFVTGAFITYKKDIRHKTNWIGNYYTDSSALLITIKEPLVEKAKSYKALSNVEAILINNEWKPVTGDLLLYFKKDSLPPNLQYGSQIILYKPLQCITNSGNPGAFNYQRFNAFHDIYYQCFLKTNEFKIVGSVGGDAFTKWLFDVRTWVVNALRANINGSIEQGVAEALLIGYRDDLDKNVVQAYSNTGVVHIIAISGLHLGMIYSTLIWLFGRFKKRAWVKWTKPLVILIILWTFSLVAGAAPSIVRSAVMFSFLLAGEMMHRKTTIYNTLAASAFTMLLFNPFTLWDVGFQLSYAAVLSIIIFLKPINNWFYSRNKIISGIWSLSAVTLSAQILTIPVVCYYFHQFPNMFLLTNFLVVPLSSIILYLELAIIMLAKIFAPLAALLGKIASGLLWFMNTFIQKVSDLPYSVTGGIQITVVQTWLLYISLIAFCFWLMQRHKQSFYLAISFALLFIAIRAADFYQRIHTDKLIIYNIPQHTAIDFIRGRDYQFAGDTVLLDDDFLQNFHLKPGRVLNRLQPAAIEGLTAAYPFYFYKEKRILLIDKPLQFNAATKMPVDVILLSKNPAVQLDQLTHTFNCKVFVFDGSNSLWKVKQWKKECEALKVPYYSTADEGAFELEL